MTRLAWTMLFFFGVCLCVGTAASSAVRPTTLKCEYQVNPLGMDVALPRLSWILRSDRRGEIQTAYQVVVAGSEAALKADKGDLWDSGKVVSNESVHVVYAGQPLRSRQRAWWKVRVWDKAGHVSAYSTPAWWEMGLLTPQDWKAAHWINGASDGETEDNLTGVKWLWYPEGDPHVNAPKATRCFRVAFDVQKGNPIRHAVLLAVADNGFAARLNGQEIGSGEDWHAFKTFEIAKSLIPGRNALAILGRNDDGPAGIAVIVRITYADGGVQRIVSGPGWKTAPATQDGWDTTGFDDSNWKEAAVIANLGDAPWNTPSLAGGMPPATYLRKTFVTTQPIRRARLYATARGLYFLSLNGRRVGNDLFRPGWTDYHKRIQYQTYDVTDMLRTGENAVGILLGDGWYCGHVAWLGRDVYGPKAQALALLEIEYADGTTQTVATDGAWKSATGPILFSDLLMGETYDARREMPGWSAPGFDDSAWKPVEADFGADRMQTELGGYPGGVPLVASAGPPVRQVDRLTPKKVTYLPDGAAVFDLGQNMVGWARLKVRGSAGTTVRLRYAEMLNPDGSIYTANLRNAKATDTYILKGGGEEVYEPSFTFHGFRYVEVTGASGRPGKAAITGIVVHSANPPAGTFACSNPLVNQLQHNIVWGQRGNYLDVPTDCPQRDERLGWMGDAQIFVRTATCNEDIAGFMTKWVQDVVDGQSPEGAFCDVSPRLGGDGAPAWGDAGVIVPWTIYECYADTRLLAQHYDAMAKWIEYIRSANPDLLWIKRSGNNYGDWLNVNDDTPRDVLATAYFAYSTHLMANIARALGKTDDAQRYDDLFAGIKAAFCRAFVAPDGRIKGDTQTDYVLALRFDLLPDALRPLAARYLASNIMDKRGGHLSTGFVGVGYLLPTLTQAGRLDVAYRLLENDTYPSWGYSIKQGATTIWERWDGWTKEKGFQDPGMNSFNHYSLGSVGEWLYESVAGIDLDPAQPGYKHIILHPHPGGGLTYAKASYDSIYGRIVSDWKRENGAFHWHVVIPANTTATVYVPAADSSRVEESGVPASQAEGVRYLRLENGFAVYQVGSGSYSFTATE